MKYIGLPCRAYCYAESHSTCHLSSDLLDATQLRSHLASPQSGSSSTQSSLLVKLQSSSPSESRAPAGRVTPPSPFGVHKAVPRAHSAFVPTRTRALAESNLLSAESAPPTGLALGSLGIPGLLDGDSQGADSPKKAGRLQHLKMRVAVRLHQHVRMHSFCHLFIYQTCVKPWHQVHTGFSNSQDISTVS